MSASSQQGRPAQGAGSHPSPGDPSSDPPGDAVPSGGEMTPRGRVLAALEHRKPDRVPLALWGSWYGVTDKLYFRILEELGWEPVEPFRPDFVHSVNYYDDRLLERLGVDVRHVDSGATAATSRIGVGGTDAWGFEWDYSGLYRSVKRHPLEDASIDEIRAFPVPEAERCIDTDGVRARLQTIRDMDDEYAVAGRAVASYGFFEMAQALRRADQLLMDLILDPNLVDAIIDRIYRCYSALTHRFLDVAGEDLDLLELPGDDFAGNEGLLISAEMFDRFFAPPYRRLIAEIKSHNPQLRVVFHSDGAIGPLLSRLADIGVDAVHPLEPLPATDYEGIKREHGGKLAFMGAIDIRRTMQGPKEGVIEEVGRRLAELGAGGGYILAPSNHLQWDVPPENVFALFEEAARRER